MRLAILGVIGVLAMNACGSDSGSGTCGQLLGTYTETPSKQWTNDATWCVPPTDSVSLVLGNNGNPIPSNCKLIGSTNSANNCTADLQEVCTTFQTINNVQYTYTSDIIGTCDNNADGSKLVCQYSFAVSYNGTDGSGGTCNYGYTDTAIRVHP